MAESAAQLGLAKRRFTDYFAYLLAIFLVLFPKGGFKVGSVPLTWGYGLLGVAICLGALLLPLKDPYRVQRATVWAFLCLLPLQALLLYTLLANGVADFGFALSDVVSFTVLPIAFLGIFPKFIPKISLDRLLSFVRWMVFLAAAYGIFLFVWRLVMGSYLEIPFLTVNVGDLGTLDDKFNSRPGGLFKLISTYNNGNQYGVATLLLLPLFDLVDKNLFRRLLLRAALVLTLSRTVWIGLVIYEGIDVLRVMIFDLSFQKLSFRRSTLFRLLRLVVTSIIVVAMTILFSGVSFLLDPSLGGRAGYLENLGHITLLPAIPLENFLEIIYYSALTMLGVAGLVAVVLLFFSPLFLAVAFKELRNNAIQVAALEGLVLYIALAAMDGALNYIPTMSFYWFLWMLLIYARGQNLDVWKVRLGNIPATTIGAGHSGT